MRLHLLRSRIQQKSIQKPLRTHFHSSSVSNQHSKQIQPTLDSTDQPQHNNSPTRNYVTNSKPTMASIVNGPVHPLDPPIPPSLADPSAITEPPSIPPPLDDVQITQSPDKKSLIINSELLGIQDLKMAYAILRDLCQAPHSVDPRTRQKLFKTSDIPEEIEAQETAIVRDSEGIPESLSITWSHNIAHPAHAAGSGRQRSVFEFKYLKKFVEAGGLESQRQRLAYLKPTLWIANDCKKINPKTDISEPHWIDRLARQDRLFIDSRLLCSLAPPRDRPDKHHLHKVALERLNEFGLVFFDGLSKRKDLAQFELKKLIHSLGLDTRNTFYGDFWDVISAGDQAKNIANTNLPLDFHMDLVHFENPPRFQFLHCIKNDVTGGVSSFVDSYSVIYRMILEEPQGFKILCRELVGFEYQSGEHHTYYKRPTIELRDRFNQSMADHLVSHPGDVTECVLAVNYAPPFQAPFLHLLQEPRHRALRKFTEIAGALRTFAGLFQPPRNPFRFDCALRPGQAVAFDNRRILHARSAFESMPRPPSKARPSKAAPPADAPAGRRDQVDRWLKGAYVDGDSVWDRIRIMNALKRD